MKKITENKYVLQYMRIIESKINFIYGKESEKKKKSRTGFLKLTPAIFAGLLFLGLLFDLGFLSAVIFAAFSVMVIIAFEEYRFFDLAKKKKRRIRLGLAEFCEGISILLDAGIPLFSSIRFTAERMGEDGALGSELKIAIAKSLDLGMLPNMEKALFNLADRCKDSSVSTFVSLVLQNARKGEDEISGLLRIHAVNLRNERSLIAKQMAEEASTLMLIPSVMVLVAIMILVAAPAVLSLIKM